MQWIDAPNHRPICWLNGPPGSGKSAVAQTIAETYGRHKRLVASFFGFRNLGCEFAEMAHFIHTLAFQLSTSVPATKPKIQRVLQNDRTILRQSLSTQFTTLLIEPITAAIQEIGPSPMTPKVIVIDALDEYKDDSLMAEFLRILINACVEHRPFPFRVLLTSRVPLWGKLESRTTQSFTHNLDLQKFDASEDISKFFRSRLSTIYGEKRVLMKEILPPWPSDPDIETLVQKAKGSFLHAVKIIDFIENGVPHRKLKESLKSDDGLGHRRSWPSGLLRSISRNSSKRNSHSSTTSSGSSETSSISHPLPEVTTLHNLIEHLILPCA